MGGIFINYRRDETAGEARALFNDLSSTVGADSVFMDVDNIAPGRDFRQVLQERLASVDVMLTLIGKDWMRITDAAGLRRLDIPNDFVRREIRAALERNISVTPILLQGAQMPAADALPEDIRDLAYRNSFELSHTRWSSDVQELIKRLGLLKHKPTDTHLSQPAALAKLATVQTAPPSAPVRGVSRSSRVWLLTACLSVLVMGIGGLLYYRYAHEQHPKPLPVQAAGDKRQLQESAQPATAMAAGGVAGPGPAQIMPKEMAVVARPPPNWKVQAHVEKLPLTPGFCSYVTIILHTSEGRSIPRLDSPQTGSSVTPNDVQLRISGPGAASFSWSRNTPGWYYICATAAAGPDVADIIIEYPRNGLAPNQLVPDTQFRAVLPVVRSTTAGAVPEATQRQLLKLEPR